MKTPNEIAAGMIERYGSLQKARDMATEHMMDYRFNRTAIDGPGKPEQFWRDVLAALGCPPID